MVVPEEYKGRDTRDENLSPLPRPTQTFHMSAYHCNIIGSTGNGVTLCPNGRPVVLGAPETMNVAFPEGWTDRQIIQWRVMTGLFDPEYIGTGR